MTQIIHCSGTFSETMNPKCYGTVTTVFESYADETNYISCSLPYEMPYANDYLYCRGAKAYAQKVEELPQEYYLLTSESVIQDSAGYLNIADRVSFDSIRVSDFIELAASSGTSTDESSGSSSSDITESSLTAADYTNLISLVIPSLVIAWSFRMICRLILNR